MLNADLEEENLSIDVAFVVAFDVIFAGIEITDTSVKEEFLVTSEKRDSCPLVGYISVTVEPADDSNELGPKFISDIE